LELGVDRISGGIKKLDGADGRFGANILELQRPGGGAGDQQKGKNGQRSVAQGGDGQLRDPRYLIFAQLHRASDAIRLFCDDSRAGTRICPNMSGWQGRFVP
jgi:hypothetical protein